jgi:dimeric dUTPase (all-alpha-NTP-PPase superfamily)
MNTDLTEMSIMQAKLDEMILQNHGIKKEADLSEYKVLDLIDELAELMNKTRCHKYWTKKPPNSREDLLEEYVDGLHFTLSIGNDIEAPTVHHLIEKRKSLVEQFRTLFIVVNEIYTPIGFTLFLAYFKGLGKLLGFDWQKDVVPAYYKKYEINIERQKEGY